MNSKMAMFSVDKNLFSVIIKKKIELLDAD